MISDIREFIKVVGGEIRWNNPKVIWDMDYYTDSNGKSFKWIDMSEKTLELFIIEMNNIFIYGYGSNNKV